MLASRLRRHSAAVLGVAGLLAGAGPATAQAQSAGGAALAAQFSHDPFTNASSQHATEVEPDTFADHGTVIAAYQVGRFFDGGATDIGFARSTDKGATWSDGVLPGLTATSGVGGATGAPYERVSDASVAYDARHDAWLVSSIPITAAGGVPTIFISRSTDDGVTWSTPASTPPPVANTVNLDKNWTACDNTPASPYYGHCYTEFDNYGDGDKELMSTSVDGGVTWGTPVETAGHDKGLGGQPVVRPDGTVVVPFESTAGKISSFTSSNGGASWTRAVVISGARLHAVGGGLRTSPLPSAEIAGDGTVYTAWEDCRFRKGCTANDIVFATSPDGRRWSTVKRVPIDAVTSGVDHFIPGLAVDRSTSGAGTHVALTYYFYPDTSCTGGCALTVGYIASADGGATWGSPTTLAGPMSLSDIAQTSQGPMVGDYISSSFVGGNVTSAFSVGLPHTGAALNQGMYAPALPLGVPGAAQATNPATSGGQVTGEGTGETHAALRDD